MTIAWTNALAPYHLCPFTICFNRKSGTSSRRDSVYAPSQWGTTLQCNVVSHWPIACTEHPLAAHLSDQLIPYFQMNASHLQNRNWHKSSMSLVSLSMRSILGESSHLDISNDLTPVLCSDNLDAILVQLWMLAQCHFIKRQMILFYDQVRELGV